MFTPALRNLRAAALLSTGAVLAGVLLTGCTSPSNGVGTALAGSPAPTAIATPAAPTPTSLSQAAATAGRTQAQAQGKRPRVNTPPGPRTGDQSCTDLYDYTGDSRDNATINSIGNDTGTCPPVQR
jgi:hypothetical protein